ncbi:MAG: stage 0 sporulation family protein [Thermodesulfobacteriota bacterium]
MARVVGVRFRKACKVYDFNAEELDVKPGDTVIVEVDRGLGMGVVANDPIEKDEGKLSHKLKNVIRKADTVDVERQSFNHERESEAFKVCKEKIEETGLEMKLIRVEYLFDSSKAIFYFTSEGRIDFRVLVKELASCFHTRIEMRQIGVRDEAKVVGGIGPCGRELCCTNFLSNFAPVTVKMAKEQNLALNPSKISGLCGRLMCCLSYEYRSYQKGPRGRGGGAAHCGDKEQGRPAGARGAKGARGCCAVPEKPSERRSNDERRTKDDTGSVEEKVERDDKKTGQEGVGSEEKKRPERDKRKKRRRRRRPRSENRAKETKGTKDGAQGESGGGGGGGRNKKEGGFNRGGGGGNKKDGGSNSGDGGGGGGPA